uniref:F-box domain-containing protein n=1 Tax=Oryza meridionalis TaxID=40149 RepID=A0A0E0F7W1_9ORYZ
MSTEGFAELTRKCPLLENIFFSGGGHRRRLPAASRDGEAGAGTQPPPLALSIAAELRHLRRLTLQGISVSNGELMAIVDGCPRLELLDVCSCWDLYVDDDAGQLLLAKCARIRTLKLPPSEEDDYYYNQLINGHYADLFDDDYYDD